MLNKQVKNLFKGEQVVRDINTKIDSIYIDQLARGDLGIEEKEQLIADAKKHLATVAAEEQQNSEYWYKYGVIDGEIKGMWKAIGVFAVSYALGTLLFRK